MPRVDFPPKSLIQFEAHFYADLHSDRTTIFSGRIETPLLNCFYGLLVEAHADSTLNTNVVWFTIRTDDHRKHTSSFNLCLPSLISVLRIGRRERTRC